MLYLKQCSTDAVESLRTSTSQYILIEPLTRSPITSATVYKPKTGPIATNCGAGTSQIWTSRHAGYWLPVHACVCERGMSCTSRISLNLENYTYTMRFQLLILLVSIKQTSLSSHNIANNFINKFTKAIRLYSKVTHGIFSLKTQYIYPLFRRPKIASDGQPLHLPVFLYS